MPSDLHFRACEAAMHSALQITWLGAEGGYELKHLQFCNAALQKGQLGTPSLPLE
jgi:hypothetical protein